MLNALMHASINGPEIDACSELISKSVSNCLLAKKGENYTKKKISVRNCVTTKL